MFSQRVQVRNDISDEGLDRYVGGLLKELAWLEWRVLERSGLGARREVMQHSSENHNPGRH